MIHFKKNSNVYMNIKIVLYLINKIIKVHIIIEHLINIYKNTALGVFIKYGYFLVISKL